MHTCFGSNGCNMFYKKLVRVRIQVRSLENILIKRDGTATNSKRD